VSPQEYLFPPPLILGGHTHLNPGGTSKTLYFPTERQRVYKQQESVFDICSPQGTQKPLCRARRRQNLYRGLHQQPVSTPTKQYSHRGRESTLLLSNTHNTRRHYPSKHNISLCGGRKILPSLEKTEQHARV